MLEHKKNADRLVWQRHAHPANTICKLYWAWAYCMNQDNLNLIFRKWYPILSFGAEHLLIAVQQWVKWAVSVFFYYRISQNLILARRYLQGCERKLKLQCTNPLNINAILLSNIWDDETPTKPNNDNWLAGNGYRLPTMSFKLATYKWC